MGNKYRTPTYAAWNAMKQRCNNPNNPDYLRYGGRGISYDPRWELFKNFLEDMGERPHYNLSLDRIDNDKSYSKSNCRWATASEQACNTSKNPRNKSGIKGVSFHERDQLWLASRSFGLKRYQLYRGYNYEAACLAVKNFESLHNGC